jgi:hypothetical protein
MSGYHYSLQVLGRKVMFYLVFLLQPVRQHDNFVCSLSPKESSLLRYMIEVKDGPQFPAGTFEEGRLGFWTQPIGLTLPQVL